MSLVMHFSPALKTGRAQAILDALDADTNPATLKIYTGDSVNGLQPAAGAAITTETLLATYTLDHPAGTVSGDTFSLTLPDAATVVAEGIAVWGRLADGAGNWVIDGNAGIENSGAFFIFDELQVYVGGSLNFTAGSIQEP
jgi:hypothetical protein